MHGHVRPGQFNKELQWEKPRWFQRGSEVHIPVSGPETENKLIFLEFGFLFPIVFGMVKIKSGANLVKFGQIFLKLGQFMQIWPSQVA